MIVIYVPDGVETMIFEQAQGKTGKVVNTTKGYQPLTIPALNRSPFGDLAVKWEEGFAQAMDEDGNKDNPE